MPKIVTKTWGQEIEMCNNELYCGKILKCTDRWSSEGKFHYHKIKDETFYILYGRLVLNIKESDHIITEKEMLPNDSIRIKPGTKHRFKGDPTCTFVEISTPHSNEDSYRE